LNKLIPLLAFSILLLVPVGAQNVFAGPSSDCSTNPTVIDLTLNPGESDTFMISCTFFPLLFQPIDTDLVFLPSDCQSKGIDFTNLSGILINDGGGDTNTFDISVTNISVPSGVEEHCTMSYQWVSLVGGGTLFATDQEIWLNQVGELMCGPGTVEVNGVCLCEQQQCIGGVIIDTDTISLLAGTIGIDPLLTGLIGITIGGLAVQAVWFVHRRKKKIE